MTCTWCRGGHVCVDCQHVADGAAAERARIVAMLREEAEISKKARDRIRYQTDAHAAEARRGVLEEMADRIEGGEE